MKIQVLKKGNQWYWQIVSGKGDRFVLAKSQMYVRRSAVLATVQAVMRAKLQVEDILD